MHEATAEPIPFPSRVAGRGDDPLTASRRRGARQLLAQAIGAGVAARSTPKPRTRRRPRTDSHFLSVVGPSVCPALRVGFSGWAALAVRTFQASARRG